MSEGVWRDVIATSQAQDDQLFAALKADDELREHIEAFCDQLTDFVTACKGAGLVKHQALGLALGGFSACLDHVFEAE